MHAQGGGNEECIYQVRHLITPSNSGFFKRIISILHDYTHLVKGECKNNFIPCILAYNFFLITIYQTIKFFKNIICQQRYDVWIIGVRKKLFVHEKNYYYVFSNCHSYYQL